VAIASKLAPEKAAMAALRRIDPSKRRVDMRYSSPEFPHRRNLFARFGSYTLIVHFLFIA
jgi:hypothetical protein